MPVLFTAARRNLLSKRMVMMQRLGIRVDMAQSECVALHLSSGEWLPSMLTAPAPPPKRPSPAGRSLMLDVGGDGGNLMVSSPTGLWVRHLGFGGYSVSRAVIQRFNLTAAQAEKLKSNPAAGANLGEFYRAIEPAVEDFVHEIGVSLAAYAKGDHSQTIRQMLAVGGGFQLHGLLAYLHAR